MADNLLGVRGGEPVGKHWSERFVTCLDQLKIDETGYLVLLLFYLRGQEYMRLPTHVRS
jgi:hypothetical protein